MIDFEDLSIPKIPKFYQFLYSVNLIIMFIPLSSTSKAPVCTNPPSTEFPRKKAEKQAKIYKITMNVKLLIVGQ